MNIIEINEKINSDFDSDIYKQLSDSSLLDVYKHQTSVIKQVEYLKTILEKNNIFKEKIDTIINEYILKLIPPGTKGVVRGNLFNKLVKNKIITDFANKGYEIEFEKKYNNTTDEIPDWYIKNKDIVIIGFNQLDLWSGGAQTNRASKYLNIKLENIKIVNVVCNYIQLTEKSKKVMEIFKKGFMEDKLVYYKRLSELITKLLI